MTIPASTVTGGHATDGEIVDNQAAINALCSVFHFGGTSVKVLHGNATGDPTYSAVDLTADVTGTLPINKGGTNGTTAAVNGAVVYSTATAYAMTAAGTSGQLLQSAGAASPVWAGDTAWTAVTFSNSWVDDGTMRTAAYFKDASGFVHLRGLIKSGTINTAAFTLPAGYRPSTRAQFPTADGVGALGYVMVNTTGTVVPQTGSNLAYNLDHISFDTR